MLKHKTLTLVAVIFLLTANVANILAQENKKEFIKIEFKAKSESFSHTGRVPIIDKSFKDYSPKQDEVYLESIGRTECFDCIFNEVEFFSAASRLNENSSEVLLFVRVKDRKECNIENQEFIVQRGKRKEFKSKCGLKISAYYE